MLGSLLIQMLPMRPWPGSPFPVLKARLMQPCVEDSAEAEGNKAKKAVHSIGCIGSYKICAAIRLACRPPRSRPAEVGAEARRMIAAPS